MRKGFTLVELSIVLVIIGLLIGGILAAQSMIGTAKIQALVRQVGQFDAAVENFQTKYQQLPGDNTIMGTWHGANNNDGIISEYSAGAANQYFRNELARFWSDLSQTGLANPNGAAYIDASNFDVSAIDNRYVPQSVAGNNTIILALGLVAGQNYYLFTNYQGNSPMLNNLNGAFKAADILAIDQKVDDGLANNGNVSGWDAGGSGFPPTYAIDAPTINSCTTVGGGPTYSVNNSSNTCSLRIRMGTSTGNLK